jgi:hypothetical protein
VSQSAPRITQKDILVITAYSGQTVYLISRLWRRKINHVGEGEVRVTQVRVMTSGSVQGMEAPIVFACTRKKLCDNCT